MKMILCCFFTLCFALLVKPDEGTRYLPHLAQSGEIEYVDLLSEPIQALADQKHITYYIYSINNPIPDIVNDGDVEQLSKSPHFDPKKLTIFIIHGWMDNFNAPINNLVKSAILNVYDVNVIVVDWHPLASKNYITAKNAVVPLGVHVGNFINRIVSRYGLTGNDFILIGHSLGAHLAGSVGSTTNGTIYHIIGLDPAGPLYSTSDLTSRLDPSDAQFVQAIHTNGRVLGYSNSLAHLDFFPNGGMVQPGCGLDLTGACSHSRCIEFLAEAILQQSYFIGTECSTYKNYENKKCTDNLKTAMGHLFIHYNIVGDFYLKTNSKSPFAQN